MEGIDSKNVMNQIIDQYEPQDNSDKLKLTIPRESRTDGPKSGKPLSAMATIRALGSMNFLHRKKPIEKSKSALMLSTSGISKSDSNDKIHSASILSLSENKFDELSSSHHRISNGEGNLDAFRLFSNNVMTSVLVTQVCVLYQDTSTNLRVSLNCSVLELLGTILSKISMNGSKIGFNLDPAESMLGKKDVHHPGMQIWMNPDHHALSYGILQGDILTLRQKADFEILIVDIPLLHVQKEIRYGYDCTVSQMIKDLKIMNNFEEKLQCGLYHPRQGMWLDQSKTLLTYDLANQKMEFRTLSNEFMMRIKIVDYDQTFAIKVLPSFCVSDLLSIVRYQMQNRKLIHLHNGKYGVRLGNMPEWLQESKALEEYPLAKSETVMYQIEKKLCAVKFRSIVYEMFVASQDTVADLIQLVLKNTNETEVGNFTLFNTMGEKYLATDFLWKVLKESFSSKDMLLLRPNPMQVQVQCQIYPDLSLYFEVDSNESLDTFVPNFCRKFGLDLEKVQVWNIKAGVEVDQEQTFVSLGITEETQLLMKVVETIEPKVDPKEEFLMTQFQDPNNTLHLATLESLVEKLTESVPDGSVGYLDFVKTFLLTYQSFCDAEELLIALQKRFDVINTQNYDWKTFNEHRKPVQLRVCNVLLQWVKKYPFDFLRQDGGADAIEILLHYIDTVLAEDHIALAKQLRKNLIKLRDSEINTKKETFLPIQNPDDPFDDLIANEIIFKFSAEEIADQFTLIEWNLFVAIMPHEVLNQAWTKKDAHVRSPNITALSRRFNSVAQWIASCILCLKTSKLRGERMSKIIDVANVLVHRNNYSTLMAIIAGINKAAISRLKQSAKDMSPKSQKVCQVDIA